MGANPAVEPVEGCVLLRPAAEESTRTACESFDQQNARRYASLTPRRLGVHNLFLHTEDQFAVIGGQHFASAVKKLFDHKVKDLGINVDKVDEGIRYVQAEILKSNAPIQIAKYAAGLNQQGQMAGRDCTTEDVVEALIERIRRKRKSGASLS
jgi:hypothetical protein